MSTLIFLVLYLVLLLVIGAFVYAVSFHYLRFRFVGDSSGITLAVFLVYVSIVAIFGFGLILVS